MLCAKNQHRNAYASPEKLQRQEMILKSIDCFVLLRDSIRAQLFEDSENSIQNIISSLAWNDSIYRTFNEGLRLSRNRPAHERIPKSLVDYVHRAHLAYVIMALRKLYDDKKEGARAVNSLRTITKQIVDNLPVFTRENYVTYDGTPYEEKSDLDWKVVATVNGRHHQFDLLCGFSADSPRKRTDRVDPRIPASIHQGTMLRSEIETFANKFLAHSAARKNRPDEEYAFKGLTLGKIQLQYKNAIWASQQIGRFLCEPILTEVPSPQFDVLEQWENGLFDPRIKRKLLTYWYGRMSWWKKWTVHYWRHDRLFLHT
jgi:hypothetical protein